MENPPWCEVERPCKFYDCSYRHDDATWTVKITAYDDEDAKARVATLGQLKLDGELCDEIPAAACSVPGVMTYIRVYWAMRDHLRWFFTGRRPD